MKIRKTIGLLTLAALFVTACSEEETLTGYTISVKSGTVNGKVNPITITDGFAMVNEVELEKDSNDIEMEIDIEGAYRFNLITGTSSPSFPVAQIQAGVYQELEIEMGKEDGDTAIYIEATYDDGQGLVLDIEVAITHELSFELEDEVNGINIDPNTISGLDITLDLEKILGSINWDNAQLSNGIISVDKNNNTDIYDQIRNSLNVEIELDEDDD